ncbi:RNA exonuclease 5-like isoform X2 [Synchiropus splendidus]|uniref:RNA exonuclease 5-like isoform X2 n=1 Tax=Synchiropus splendidus TaxID=270530 RepID=UPI00237DA91E|nr:RNA exonuclease 5-like isoform X2 [Synchiropus splendidus]
MEPFPSTTVNGRKRKIIDSVARKRAKLEGEATGDDQMSKSGPRITVAPEQLQSAITAQELMELLHYAALGKGVGIKQPSWCRLHRQRKLTGVNVVVVEGLTQSDFTKHYLAMKHLRSSYTTRVAFRPGADSLLSQIFSSEVTRLNCCRKDGQLGKLPKALQIHPVIMKYGIKTRGLTAYVLSEEEMVRRHFPVKGTPGSEDYVSTNSSAAVTDESPLYGLDCEMCLTQKGMELTRVSLVDARGTCLMDQLVKPNNRIISYHTQFSGITAAMLRPVTTRLRDVQVKLKSLLPEDAVLVGHSLDNDLRALKMIHRHVLDTSLLFTRELGQRFKLKVLAEVVLKKPIQTQERLGHDPVEDAVAALELAQYFIQEGPLQVVERHLEELWGISLDKDSADSPPPSSRFADVLQDLGISVSFYGKRFSNYALPLSYQHWHQTDKQVVSSFRKQTKPSFLSFLQLSSFSSRERCSEDSSHPSGSAPEERSNLGDMRVVFAGPLPFGATEKDVRKLFRCCGEVQMVKMLRTALRLHAMVEFVLLESAVLAVRSLDGIHLQGQAMKVQRPVIDTLLDLDLTLDALTEDPLNCRRLYVARLSSSMAKRIGCSTRLSPEVNGHVGRSAAVSTKTSRLTEETLRGAFGHFGSLDVTLFSVGGKLERHAFIEFGWAEEKCAALRSSEDLWKQQLLVCPALTPPHVLVTRTTAETEECEGDESWTSTQSQDIDSMIKLDSRLRKVYNALPECTLSVVMFAGCSSAEGDGTGLCLLEIKR